MRYRSVVICKEWMFFITKSVNTNVTENSILKDLLHRLYMGDAKWYRLIIIQEAQTVCSYIVLH